MRHLFFVTDIPSRIYCRKEVFYMCRDKTDPYCEYYFKTDSDEDRKKRYTEKWFWIIQRAEKRKQSDYYTGDVQ